MWLNCKKSIEGRRRCERPDQGKEDRAQNHPQPSEDEAEIVADGAPKNINFPTDAKLLHAAIKGLTRLARKHGVRLRQSYLRTSIQRCNQHILSACAAAAQQKRGDGSGSGWDWCPDIAAAARGVRRRAPSRIPPLRPEVAEPVVCLRLATLMQSPASE
jgi:hypothetical protein